MMIIDPYRFGPQYAAQVPFGNVAFLCHMEEITGATITTAVPGGGGTFQVSGTTPAALSATQARFGAKSLTFPATDDLASTSENYSVGTADFTFEAWTYVTVANVQQWPFAIGHNGQNGVWPRVYYHTDGSVRYLVNTTDQITSAASVIQTNVWQHIAVSRAAGVTRMFVDGEQVGSNYTDANDYTPAKPIWVGHSNTAGDTTALRGYIDEVRLTIGTGRYTVDFLPDDAAFPDS